MQMNDHPNITSIYWKLSSRIDFLAFSWCVVVFLLMWGLRYLSPASAAISQCPRRSRLTTAMTGTDKSRKNGRFRWNYAQAQCTFFFSGRGLAVANGRPKDVFRILPTARHPCTHRSSVRSLSRTEPGWGKGATAINTITRRRSSRRGRRVSRRIQSNAPIYDPLCHPRRGLRNGGTAPSVPSRRSWASTGRNIRGR